MDWEILELKRLFRLSHLGRAILFSLALIQGCSTVEPVPSSDDARTRIRAARDITVVHYAAPVMSITIPSDARAAAGKPHAVSGQPLSQHPDAEYARRLMEEFDLPDPMEILAARFVKEVQEEAELNNLKVVEQPLPLELTAEGFPLPDSKVTKGYWTRYGDGLLLEMTMPTWSMHYKPFNWSSYAMLMQGQLRVIRLSDSRVLGTGLCSVNGHKDDSLAFKIMSMDGSEGRRLREGIDTAAQQCAEQLARQFRFIGQGAMR